MDVIIEHPGWLSLTIEDWRNLVLIGAAAIGLPLATWRSWVAHRQVKLAEAGQNLDRYQKGAAMLGDDRESVRVAGINGLFKLVTTDPENYYGMVSGVLVAFIAQRSETQRNKSVEQPVSRDSLTALLAIVSSRNISAKKHPEKSWWREEIDLSKGYFVRAELDHLDLAGIVFEGANFNKASFQNASIERCNFRGAQLNEIDLNEAKACNANFSYASMISSHLHLCDLRGSTFTSTNLVETNLDNSDLSDADFNRANLEGVSITGANLANTSFYFAVLKDIEWNTMGHDLPKSDSPINANREQFDKAKNVDPDFLEWLSSEQNQTAFQTNQ